MNTQVVVKLLGCCITCDVYNISGMSFWSNIDHFWELLTLIQAIKDWYHVINL